MTMSTVFMTARHSFDDLPRTHRVQPLLRLPRISYHVHRASEEGLSPLKSSLTHAAMSNATFNSCDTLRPGRISMLPGDRHTTGNKLNHCRVSEIEEDSRFVTLPCMTSTPFGLPVVPVHNG